MYKQYYFTCGNGCTSCVSIDIWLHRNLFTIATSPRTRLSSEGYRLKCPLFSTPPTRLALEGV